MVVGKRRAVYRLLSTWTLNHLGLSPVASGEDVGISSEPGWQGGIAAEAGVLKLRVKGWEEMPFELPGMRSSPVCCNRTVESELFVSFLKSWREDSLWLVSH